MTNRDSELESVMPAGTPVSEIITVGFSHARYHSGNRTSSIGMGARHAPYGTWHAATVALSKAKLL